MVPLTASLLIAVSTVAHAENGCEHAPKPVEECRIVHGRLSASNGTWGAVIWPVGTRRLLAVAGDSEENLYMPQSLRSQLPENFVFGYFTVCPITPFRKGERQVVCVQSATHTVVRKP